MKRCLAKLHAQLRDFNTSDVKDAANVYRARGMEERAANVAAVEDHLRQLRRQRSQVEAAVLSAWKERDPDSYAKASPKPRPEPQKPEARLSENERSEPASAPSAEAPTPKAVEAEVPRFSRATDLGLGISGPDFRLALVNAFGAKAAAKMADRLVLVATQDALPSGMKRFLRDGDIVHGAAYNGKAYVVLENVTPKMVRGLVLHELGVHVGMEKMLGADLYASTLKRLDAMHAAGNKAVVKARELAEQEAANPDQVPEEVLAYLVQTQPEMPLIRRVIAAVKAWAFREYGIGATVLTVDDMASLAKAAALKAGEAPVISTEAEPAWHRTGTEKGGVPKPASVSRNSPEWARGNKALESAVGKVDTFRPEATIREKVKGLTDNWKLRLVQGVFDAYAPLKRLGPTEYVKARMVKSVDGAMEGLLLYGKPVMGEDGAIHGDIDRKGFLGAMQDLQGEHDRFLLWVAGNRAERLMREDREHLFTPEEVQALKRLDEGKMKSGASRKEAFAKAALVLREYNQSVLDIAEKTGLIDGESRHLWEHDFYVPFFRVEEEATIAGPSRVKGLVRQQAFKKLKGGQEPLGDLLENTLRNWAHLLSASMANQAAAASLKAAEKLGVAEQVPEGTRDATFAMVDGKKVHYTVSDPLVMQAISAMESASFKGLPMKVMGKFKYYLTLGVTVSPTFRIRNLMRDSLSAIGQNEMSYNVVSNLYQGFKGSNRQSDEYAQMLFNGAMMRFGQLTDGKHAEHAKRLIDSGVDDSTILTNPEKVKAALGKMWDGWQEFGDRMENINRTALYKQLKAEGKSDIEAAFAARDMLDFSLQGSWVAVRFLTQIVPFMNARLQGMYKLGRAAKQDPARLGYVAGAVSLASIALLLAYGSDDEWKKREDWDRDSFWWFRIGDTAYRIPKPFEIGAIGTIAERSVELMLSDEMTGKRFGERLKSMVGDTFALNPIPQLFKPMLDLYSNVDSFTGRTIESRGMQSLSKPERTTPYTSLVGKLIGKAGNATGLSPVQVDHLIRSYFGWLGSHAAMTVDVLAQPFMETKAPARKLGDMFVIGDFVKDLPSDRSRYVEQFYKQAKVVHEAVADLRQAREAKDASRVAEILKERRSDLALSNLYTAAEQRMTDVNRKIRLVYASKKDPEEKRAELDRLNGRRNELARVTEMRATKRRAAAVARQQQSPE